MQAENLKRELLTNEVITKLFGSIRSEEGFSKEQWITSFGSMVFPRGSGQQVRGVKYGYNRPDLIICDDLEDAESVMNEDSRKKLKHWFFADVLNSVNRAHSDWKVVVIGTLLHEDSLLANLLEDPSWHPITLPLFDDHYKSNWPEFMSDEAVLKLVDEHRKQGQLDTLYREYAGQAISTEDATFLSQYFKYYSELQKPFGKDDVETVIIIDPAKTVKLHSAESAVLAVGVDLRNGAIYLRDLIAEKMYPDKLYNATFEMAKQFEARVIGIEVTSLHEFIVYPIKTEMMRQGLNYEIVELQARAKKEERIAQLVPLYRRGLIYHNESCCAPLEAQLLSFPRSKRFDCMDAFAYIVELLEKGERYFFAKEDKAVEKEYEGTRAPEDEFNLPDDYGDAVVSRNNWRMI
jgi:phage terminase large subunit-like protein